MKIALLGIYGGIDRDFNPGNVLIGYYTEKMLKKNYPNAIVDIYSIDFSMQKDFEKVECFKNTGFAFTINFFKPNYYEKILEHLNKNYDAIVIGGDVIWGVHDIFLLESNFKFNEDISIVLNSVSTLWKNYTISNKKKVQLKKLAGKSSYVSVRSNSVKDLLLNAEVDNDIKVIPDPVLIHTKNSWEKSEKVKDIIKTYNIDRIPTIGISDSILNQKYMIESLIKSNAINEYQIIFYSYSKRYNHKDITTMYKDILGDVCFYIEEYLNPWDTFSLIGELDINICNAFHSCIASATQETSFIGIDPSPYLRSRHNEMILDRETLSNNLVKNLAIDNDGCGDLLTDKINYVKSNNYKSIKLDKERELIENHFKDIIKIL